MIWGWDAGEQKYINTVTWYKNMTSLFMSLCTFFKKKSMKIDIVMDLVFSFFFVIHTLMLSQ